MMKNIKTEAEQEGKEGRASDDSRAHTDSVPQGGPARPQSKPDHAAFDPARLRLSQNFAQHVGVKKLITTVSVSKPNRQQFFRIHPDQSYRLQTAVIELQSEGELYLVEPALRDDLANEIIAVELFTGIDRSDALFLLPVKLPDSTGRHNEWHRSLYEAASRAMSHWVRVVANRSLGAYEIFESSADLPDPVWPDVTFAELLRIAFRDRYIASRDHPVLRQLRGEL